MERKEKATFTSGEAETPEQGSESLCFYCE